jgi:outer membrane protein with beta-barrel domain
MRVQQWIMVAALALMPALAAAQEGTTATTNTTTAQSLSYDDDDSGVGGWFGSLNVGSDFARDVEDRSMDFGGTLGYSNGWFGAEVLAGFTPNFAIRNNFLGEDPQVNNYMFNLIGSAPIGRGSQFRPYVSGGLGIVTLRSDMLNGNTDALNETAHPSDSQMGGNVGFGVLGFSGGWGLRADVRYIRAFRDDELQNSIGLTDSNTTPTSQLANVMLSGLDFWRANIGLAFRW